MPGGPPSRKSWWCWMLVAEEFTDFGQRSTLAKHLRGQRVSEEMSALTWGMDCSADQGALDEIRDCPASKADARCALTDE